MSSINVAIRKLNDLGFEGIKAIDADSVIPKLILIPIMITGLEGAPNFTIIPLDATSAQEFNDLIYVSIEEGSRNVLEAACVSRVPQIYDDQAMDSILRGKYPRQSFEIIPGYYWKSCIELGSFLSIARRFRLEGREMFLLPGGIVVDRLSTSDVGGA